jgi:hypothetical protein
VAVEQRADHAAVDDARERLAGRQGGGLVLGFKGLRESGLRVRVQSVH